MITRLDLSGIEPYITTSEMWEAIAANSAIISQVIHGDFAPSDQMGWFSPNRWKDCTEIDRIISLAQKIRSDGDVFILIGVGGSNRGAQSVIETLGDKRVEILYAGNNLSSQAITELLKKIKGKSIYLNIIAKDFNTLEPGIWFRILRQYMEKTYAEDARNRIIATGSDGSGQLHELSKQYGYTFLPFPEDMAGRFSVLSAVGFLPMAVAGVDIKKVIQAAVDAEKELKATQVFENMAVQYAVCRNLLFKKGFVIENLVTLEPSMAFFARWWSQLFGESEGKGQQSIFPTFSSYSEDLHAIGQYIQDGTRMVMETFLDARFENPEIRIEPSLVKDGFDYLNFKDFDSLNRAVYEAAFVAHKNGGVPCFQFHYGKICEEMFGEFFYLFMISCCISALMINVNPFGQAGVEAYKKKMYQLLGK